MGILWSWSSYIAATASILMNLVSLHFSQTSIYFYLRMSLFLILGIQQHFPRDTEAGVCGFFVMTSMSELLNYAKCIDYSV